MKKISQDPFSNGTEFMNWESNNCDQCVKASRYIEKEDRYTPVRCAVSATSLSEWVAANRSRSGRMTLANNGIARTARPSGNAGIGASRV